MADEPGTASPPLPQAPHRHPISARSVLLGLLGTIFICGLTPYNDYALNNTFLVGNNLPLGVVMLTFLFVLLINGPLNRWAPRHAFTAGEITIAFSMTLVSCALPSSGLMRYFPPSLVIPFWHARGHPEFLQVVEGLDLPRWLFPSFEGDRPSDWINDPIVTGFYGRWTLEEPYPLLAWVVPALAWAVFIFALYAALLCMVALVRRQWHENERLPFPLAQIHLALIEQPPPRRWLNGILSQRSFWVAFTAIFLLHAWNGMHHYWPQYVERIPVYYSLPDLFSEPPWVYVDWKMKDAAVFFTVVGVTYFLSTPVAFSLWFFFILMQIYRMWMGSMTGVPDVHGMQDQHFGGIVAFTLVILWVGRRHWRLILLQAFRGERPGEPRGRYMPYSWAFWGLVGSAAIMVGWLVTAGATLLGAMVVILLLLVLFFVITRIIAETGLVHGQLQVPLYKPWQLSLISGWGPPVPMKTFYLTALLQSHHYDFREVVPVYASHGLKVADQTVYRGGDSDQDSRADRSTGRRLILLFMLALIVGYFVSFTSMLWTEYTHAATRDISETVPINDWGSDAKDRWLIVEPTVQYEREHIAVVHNPWGHMAFGFLFTGTLGFLRLAYTWWPLHPIGYLMLGTFPGNHLWFSIMIGWLCKVLIVRFGGAGLYAGAKPFFIGLIVGESGAAGFWLVMGVVLSLLDVPYRPVNIMPG